jgi:hypothetical protein
MFIKLWARTMLVILIISVVSTGVFTGCSNQKAKLPIFSEIDSKILTSAYTDYESLKQDSSPVTARQELVKKLNDEKGVADAYIGTDGTSIFFTYDDGFLGIIDTYDPSESPPQTTAYLPKGKSEDILNVNCTTSVFASNKSALMNNVVYIVNSRSEGYQPPVSLAVAQIAQNATTLVPASKKVLILQPICPGERAYTPVASGLPAYFKANGWEDDDIDLKMNMEEINEDSSPFSYKSDGSGLLVVKPEDYYDLNKYGVILFLGHCATGAEVGDPQQYYLEFANITSQTLKENTQLRTWALNQQLAVGFLAQSTNAKPDDSTTNIYRLFIRSDLLREKMGELPQSYVQLASCHGSGFQDIFTGNGATDFMSWDSRVDPVVADNNVENMVKLMLAGKSALDSYNDSSVIKIDDGRQHWGAEFVETMNPESHYYLPAWINLKVPALPVGTSHLKVEINDTSKNIYITEDKTITPGQTSVEINDFGGNCFSPGPCSVAIRALDGKGSTLLSNTSEFNLHVGANKLTMGSSKYQYTISGSQDPQTGVSFSTQGVTALQITLNGQYVGGANSNWTGALGFDAQPGDVLEIRVVGTTGEYVSPGIFSTSLSALWFTSWATGDQVKITDGGNFSQYFNGAETVVLDVKFTIPGKKPSTTQTPKSPTTTTSNPTSPTTATPITTTPTTTLPTTQPTSRPLTHVDVWLTTTNDSKAAPVSTLKAGSVTVLYIWAKGGNGQAGDFTLSGNLQNGTQMQLGSTKHATSGDVIYCGQWNGGFLNTVGTVSVNAVSSSTTVGGATINITN